MMGFSDEQKMLLGRPAGNEKKERRVEASGEGARER